MELFNNDFKAKAQQVSAEVELTLKDYQKKHSNRKILPPQIVEDIFVRAIAHYLQWAYNEGVEHGQKLQNTSDK